VGSADVNAGDAGVGVVDDAVGEVEILDDAGPSLVDTDR